MRFADMIRRNSGMIIDEGKLPMLCNRIAERMRANNLASRADYLDMLGFSEHAEEELRELIESVLIHETLFYRDVAQMSALESAIFPELIRSAAADENNRPLNIWSAGCSTGAEPYSIVMAFEEAKRALSIPGAAVRVLATDMSGRALAAAAAGIYQERPVRNAPEHIRRRHFREVIDPRVSTRPAFSVVESIRKPVRFRRLNLISDEFPRGLDMIVCRNVLIYFDAALRRRVMEGFYRALKPEGFLVLGNAETLLDWPEYFQAIFSHGSCHYRKWTSCRRRNARAPAEHVAALNRRPPEKQPPPELFVENKLASWKGRTVESSTLTIAGLLDRNADSDRLKQDLLIFLGAAAPLTVIDLSEVAFVSNHCLRTIRQALAAAECRRVSTVIVARDGKILSDLESAKLADHATLMVNETWRRETAEPARSKPAGSGFVEPRTTRRDVKSACTCVPVVVDRRQGHREESPVRERRSADVDHDVPRLHVEGCEKGRRFVLSGCLDPERYPDMLSRIKETLIRLTLDSSEEQRIRVELVHIGFISKEVVQVLRRASALAREYQSTMEFEFQEDRIRKFIERCGGLPAVGSPNVARTT